MIDELIQFREEVRAWLLENCPLSMRQPYRDESEQFWGGRKATPCHPDQVIWLNRMADKGWTAPEWPEEYGGAGPSSDERRVLREEMAALSCRPPLHSFGISMLAPALFKYGSEAQRREHLPPMARGAIRWCQGYSEPNAGSDLASLRMSAERCGDAYRLNGSKIWTSYADRSDWIFCLVRTDNSGDKREGITFLLIDMDSPGISTRPLKLISGASPFCQVFFDNVSAPAANRVGEEGEGWKIAKFLLTHERSMISGLGGSSRSTPSLGVQAKRSIGTTADKLSDFALRHDIALYETDALAFRFLRQTISDSEATKLGSASSVMKYVGTDLNKRRLDLAMAIEGIGALSTPWQDGEDMTPTARSWLRSKANSIEGGTSEIQLNIIARSLGMP